MDYTEFMTDLSKIQDQYDYKTHGHGSVTIYDMNEDGKRIAGVNWSCVGTDSPKYARPFAEALMEAIEACEKFNATHDMDDY